MARRTAPILRATQLQTGEVYVNPPTRQINSARVEAARRRLQERQVEAARHRMHQEELQQNCLMETAESLKMRLVRSRLSVPT